MTPAGDGKGKENHMKRILITGANSYIGLSVENYLKQWPDRYQVDTRDMIGDGWRTCSFQGYDAILHVAGLVHQPKSKEDPGQAEVYERVNTTLAVETAQKAKTDGVKQFLFMSTVGVYGLDSPVGQVVTITKDTPLNPRDNYGISKAKAEALLQDLADETFKLAILRPPMIYGPGCKGNYVTLSKLARKLPVFPWVDNQRSMLYIDNFCEFVRLLVDDRAEGIFCPQDGEYVNTSQMVNLIAHANGKNILTVKGFGWALKLLGKFTPLAGKAFGSLCYDMELSRYSRDYRVKDLTQAVMETESK